MPLARREVIQLLLLMSIVPFQYLISSQSVLSYAGSKSQVVRDIIDQFNHFIEKASTSKLWKTAKFIIWPFKSKFPLNIFSFPEVSVMRSEANNKCVFSHQYDL